MTTINLAEVKAQKDQEVVETVQEHLDVLTTNLKAGETTSLLSIEFTKEGDFKTSFSGDLDVFKAITALEIAKFEMTARVWSLATEGSYEE